MPRVKVCSKRPASLTCTTAYVAVTEEYRYITPAEESHGMLTANSLMQPQELARRILPGPTFKTLLDFATGVPAERWSSDVIEAAKHTGPHVSVNLSAQVDLPPKRVKNQRRKRKRPILPWTKLLYQLQTKSQLQPSAPLYQPSSVSWSTPTVSEKSTGRKSTYLTGSGG
jgi:hypothetical protein